MATQKRRQFSERSAAGAGVYLFYRSGGQTGVDRAVLDFALAHDLDYGGWCPQGGWAEDMPDPPGVLHAYPLLVETPSRQPEQRTAWNVRDSDATLILTTAIGLECSQGAVFTRLCAELLFLKPCLLIDVSARDAVNSTAEWLGRLQPTPGTTRLDLNIAGPRESEAPGIYRAASSFLEGLFERIDR
jgi:hypothetical protein